MGTTAQCHNNASRATPLPCPTGQRLDIVSMPGDNGSCDCGSFCASDWTGAVKKARPHWKGAVSAVRGARSRPSCHRLLLCLHT